MLELEVSGQIENGCGSRRWQYTLNQNPDVTRSD